MCLSTGAKLPEHVGATVDTQKSKAENTNTKPDLCCACDFKVVLGWRKAIGDSKRSKRQVGWELHFVMCLKPSRTRRLSHTLKTFTERYELSTTGTGSTQGSLRVSRRVGLGFCIARCGLPDTGQSRRPKYISWCRTLFEVLPSRSGSSCAPRFHIRWHYFGTPTLFFVSLCSLAPGLYLLHFAPFVLLSSKRLLFGSERTCNVH